MPGTAVTFTGSGFGATQGNGVFWLGSTVGQVVSWSDTQVVATVAAGSLTGIARIEQNDVWSNAFGFWVLPPGSNAVAQITSRRNPVPARYAATLMQRRRSLLDGGNAPGSHAVPRFTLRPDQVPGGNTMTLEPSLLNMSVGGTATIQALGANGLPVTGLPWTSSNPDVVILSTDDPPILAALAAGHVTIIAGTASADVTVFAGPLPIGTVIWSNPGDGSGVQSIVPAVPSTSGVADVFAFQADGTVQAITSDGTVAWTANLGQGYSLPESNLPDFQGGLVVPGPNGIYKLDGITGQPYPAYQGSGTFCNIAIHPDGTIFAAQAGDCEGPGNTVVGIDPITGTQKFSVAVPIPANAVLPYQGRGQMIIAGDGYAYYSYGSVIIPADGLTGEPTTCYLSVLRIDSSGNYTPIPVFTSTCAGWAGGSSHAYVGGANMITNADEGILLTWSVVDSPTEPTPQMAIITGGGADPVSPPQLPGGGLVDPVLQAQDGSFVGITGQDCSVGYGGMVSFDAAGNVRWIVPNDCPQIATADGGVIGQSGITYDQNGNATGMIPNMPTYSWTENAYTDGPVDSVIAPLVDTALSWNAFIGGNPSQNGTAAKFVSAPTFIPALLKKNDTPPSFAAAYSGLLDYYKSIAGDMKPTQVALFPRLLIDATAGRFLAALTITNAIVAYIDHGWVPDGQNNAVGLGFPYANDWLAPAALVATLPQYVGETILPNGFGPRAKVVFLAACGIDADFIAQWHLGGGQALIVPVYDPTLDKTMHINLEYAATEWQKMLIVLGNGTVAEAVAAGNAQAAANGAAHRWRAVGGTGAGNVNFKAQSQ